MKPEPAERVLAKTSRNPSAFESGTMSIVVLNQRENVQAIQFLAPAEKRKLHGKSRAFDRAPERLDKLRRRRSGSPRGQQVVANNHALARLHRVFVNLQCVRAILERVGNAGRLGG